MLIAILCLACREDINLSAPETTTQETTIPRTALGTGSFNLWGTCNGHPYFSGNGIIVPVGNCGTDIDAGQEKYSQVANGFQMYGAFKGGSNAYSSASEMAVFVCDNVSQWNGNEMGFVKTLNDNTLKAYLQGGGQYVWQVVATGNNGYHTYKAQARSSNTHQVDFYIDGVYKCTLTNNSGSYYNKNYYYVGTNHWYGGSTPSGQQLEMWNRDVW
jgi:hypothetical protein